MILSDDINQCQTLISENLEPGIELSISSDSRNFNNENCFLSLYGENFDSIKFLEDVIQKGAKFILLEKREQNKETIEKLVSSYQEISFVLFTNIFEAILELGKIRSLRFQREGGKVIGITGSNGKTTNKEMLKHLLSFQDESKVHATKGNLNNQIGVPLTLFAIEKDHEIAIVEMGTNFPGEIENLVTCAQPQYGFITNIGYAHTEFLIDLDGVFKEKTALYRGIEKREDGIFVVNSSDDYLKRLEGAKNTLSLDKDDYNLFKNETLLGEHQVTNMAMCLKLALALFPQEKDRIVEKAENYKPPGMNRGEVRSYKEALVYLDAYNANPSSMRASLNSFCAYLRSHSLSVKDTVAILGDMNELGEKGPFLHKEIGTYLRELGFESAIFVGRYSKNYAEGFAAESRVFEDSRALKQWVGEDKISQKVWFIKGSRSLQLESILDING